MRIVNEQVQLLIIFLLNEAAIKIRQNNKNNTLKLLIIKIISILFTSNIFIILNTIQIKLWLFDMLNVV